ncbi:flagellar hook protein FlgK [Bacillus manliponensis]|uniref:Flagellar hook-associated protein 1 n=1 Tax=Bacillus manliponensis TaxID=574376 RepID=A0A073K2D5_9BACI|nr:flagellar hook-associated protein FlgK [Bacillus manliponensis]KEK20627.1 flagellar hook protein FlgK [Bacillus manliponensis]
MRLSDYNTPLSGMLAAQLGLQATQQNLSNVHTPGYVRQQVNYKSVGGTNGGSHWGQIGYGVQTENIERVTDEVKTRQYNEQLSHLAYYSYFSSFMSQVESAVGTPGENSLSSLMDNFFNGFREVAKNPEHPNYYHTLIAETSKFTNQVNRIAKDFENAELTAGRDIIGHTDEFNRLAENLAEANRKIGQAISPIPNQLLNERDLIIQEMSQYANIEVAYEHTNPEIASVRISGMLTVSGQDTYKLDLDTKTNEIQISGVTVSLQGGSILAAMDAKKTVAGYRKDFEMLMSSLKDNVNTITGKDFFVGENATKLELNPVFVKDVSQMKMSVETANKLAVLGDEQYGGNMTFKQTLDKQLVQVASDAKKVSDFQKIHGDLLEGIGQQKSGIEGVNIDEEMVNLMTYQRYFIANSKAINTLNEVFDSLFSIMR